LSLWAVAIIGALASCCLVQFFGTLHLLANAREHEREALATAGELHRQEMAAVKARYAGLETHARGALATVERTYRPDPGAREEPLRALRETVRTADLDRVGRTYGGQATEEAVHRILTMHGFHRNADGSYRHAGHADPQQRISVGAAIMLAIESDREQAKRQAQRNARGQAIEE
jgi:hypothetical protein